MNLCEDFHVSLSKTFPIKKHSIEPLWKAIDTVAKEYSKYKMKSS
jgi:hypothetical protein